VCLGIPGLVVESLATTGGLDYALVEFAGLRRRVCVSCTPDVRPGEYVVVHAGIAISRLDGEEAERLLEHLRGMGESDDWDRSLPESAGGVHEISG
jgi:hydrogenase expression/formation protein HypC